MSASTHGPAGVADPLSSKPGAGWLKFRKGLKCFQVGVLVLLTFVVLNLLLVWLVTTAQAKQPGEEVSPEEKTTLLLVAALAVGLPGLVGICLVLAGFRLCRAYAPAEAGRPLLNGWLICSLAGLALFLIGLGIDEGFNYLVLRQGPAGFLKLRFGSPGGSLQLAGFSLGLVSFYLFNLFLRAVANAQEGPGPANRVDLYLLVVSLLLGTSLGLFLFLPRMVFRVEMLLGLFAGWGAIFFLEINLIGAVRSYVHGPVGASWWPEAVADEGGALPKRAIPNSSQVISIQKIPQKLSGMHRYFKSLAEKQAEG